MSAFLMGSRGYLKAYEISEHISCSELYIPNKIHLRLSALPQRGKKEKVKKKSYSVKSYNIPVRLINISTTYTENVGLVL